MGIDDGGLVNAVLRGEADAEEALRDRLRPLALSIERRYPSVAPADRQLDELVGRLAGWDRSCKLTTYATWVMRRSGQ